MYFPVKNVCKCVSVLCKSVMYSGMSRIHTSNYSYRIHVVGYEALVSPEKFSDSDICD
jgi:hypothetical protein